MKKLVFSFALLFMVTLGHLAVQAQGTTGRLSGTVSGPDGALPGATVTATDKNTAREQTVAADEEGHFLFPQLEFGTYTVKITAQGFKTFVGQDVKIDVGRDYTLNPILEIGDVTAEVVVTAGADVVTSTTAQVSNTVSPQQILSLPLITRSPLTLTSLQAGVNAANGAQNTTINGLRTTFTNITRDGINIQDTFIRSNATDFAPGRPSVDDTAEFTIALSNSEADQGYGGAQIRLVTPRGTKDFHGALFAYNRNSEFGANNFFANRSTNPDVNSKPPFRNRNQYGGKISGPMPVPGFGEGTPFLFKDKGFFFFAYEGIKDPVSSEALRTILTPSARNGGFRYNRTNNTDVTPFCASQTVGSLCEIPNILTFARSFGGNFLTIPATVDPILQARVISQLPDASNFTGLGDSADGIVRNTTGYRLVRRADQDRQQYSTRLDVDIDEKNTFHGVFNYNKETNLRPDVDTTRFTVVPAVTQSSTNKQFTVAYRRIFGSSFVNEVRGGIFTSEVPFDKTDETPSFFFGGLLVTNPENTFLSQGRNTKAFNFQDNADFVWGDHTFKFGGLMQIFRVNSYNDAATVPVVNIGTATTNVALASGNFTGAGGISTTQLGTANSMLSLFGGVFNQVQQSFNIADVGAGFQPGVRQFQPFRNENHSLYLSDRWLLNRNLTVTLGVRYELFPALRLNNGVALEPVIADVNDPIPSLLNINGTTNVIGGNAGRKNAFYKTDYNNFAPNLGAAWSPSFTSGIGKLLFGTAGKSVIRGGYSHIYGNDSIITSINNAAAGNAGLARTQVSLINLNGRVQNGVNTVNPPAFVQPPRTYLLNNSLGVGNFFGTVFAVDPKVETPKVEQYSVGFQREFFGNTAFEIRYVGSRSKNLVRGVDLNQIDIFNNGFLADFNRARANLALTGNAFCAVAGCQPLTIFQNGGAGAPGRLVVGTTGGVSAATFNNNLSNGASAELAFLFINNTANLNNHPSSANPTAVPRINFLANPAAGAVDFMVNDASFNYNSLQVEVRRRFANGLYFQANYTFSKNLTNAIGTSQALFEPYLDNNNKDLDNQRADFDLTHVFNFNGIYQLPLGKGKMFLNNGGIVDKIFGGWEISSLVQWTSGSPITLVDPRGTLNRAGRSARQTPFTTLTNAEVRALGGVYEAPNGTFYFINPSVIGPQGAASNGFGSAAFSGQAFFNVGPGQTGNMGRMIFNGPKFFNINAALLKNIRFTESIRVQLRAEAFNLLNNVNFNLNSAQQLTNIESQSFGQLTSVRTGVTPTGAREMQFAIRFEF